MYFKNTDFAMEWCEEELLKAYPVSKRTGIPNNIALILDECEKVEFKKGEHIIEAGSLANELYFLISGKAIVQLDKDNHSVRLKTLMPGTFIGELGFLMEIPRSSSVISGEDFVLYLITSKRLSEIEATNPRLLTNFYKEISLTLSERIITQNKVVELLTR